MNGKTILLVDDNPDDRDLTLRVLKANHVLNEVVVAEDGAEALELFFKPGGRFAGADRANLPTVVLLDIKLPKLDGLEVLRRLRAEERTRLLPVVILTSSREEQDLITGYKLGANSYVRKPEGFENFSAAIKQLELYWLVLNEPIPIR
jgi:two-component system response regulator